MKEPSESGFVKSLEKLRNEKNRAALAKLRRGLGKRMGASDMYPYVAPFLDSDKPWETERYFLIAALFAHHPEVAARGTSMGKVFRAMPKGESTERRFTNLLAADGDDLHIHLRQAVSLAKSKNVPVDYHQLFFDVKDWNYPSRKVQLRWARDFWGYDKDANTSTDNDNQPKGD